jgi:hypothetical protein
VVKQAERRALVNATGGAPRKGRSVEAKEALKAKPEVAKAVARRPAPKENGRGRGVDTRLRETPAFPARVRGRAELDR